MNFNFFSDDDLTRIHQASFDILKQTGIRTGSNLFKTLLSDHGCKVEKDFVKFTDDVIQKGLRTLPRTFTLFGRNDSHKVRFGKGQVYTQTIVGTPAVIDLESGQKRDCAVRDAIEATRLADALPNIDIVSPVFPIDIPPETVNLTQLTTLLRWTGKPIRLCVKSADELDDIFEILDIVAGDRMRLQKKPLAYIEVSPISPLNYSIEAAQALHDIVESGVPLGIIACPMLGATSPMTLAGCVAMHHAENIAGVVASQLLKPGAPVVVSPRATFMDMRTGVGLWAMPEMGMMAAASIQLCRKDRIPCTATGYSTASKTYDMQSGYEHLYNALLPALSGADVLGGAGSLDNCLIFCYRMLVVDNEISSVIKRTLQGALVDTETLAEDTITEVCKMGSQFLDHEHTFKHLRNPGLWMPPLGDRQTYDDWCSKAQKLEQKAADEARRLLKTHQVTPLSKEISTEMDRVIIRAQGSLQ